VFAKLSSFALFCDIANDVDSLQENKDVRLKHSRNDEENITNIIDLLIKISTLEKEKSKDHS